MTIYLPIFVRHLKGRKLLILNAPHMHCSCNLIGMLLIRVEDEVNHVIGTSNFQIFYSTCKSYLGIDILSHNYQMLFISSLFFQGSETQFSWGGSYSQRGIYFGPNLDQLFNCFAVKDSKVCWKLLDMKFSSTLIHDSLYLLKDRS